MSDFFYDDKTDTLFVYKTIKVSEYLLFKKKYKHVEVIGKGVKK